MRVLGIDPGSSITGYGIVERDGNAIRHIDNGGVRVGARLSFPERLRYIHDELAAIIRTYRPDCVAIEKVFVAKNAKTSLVLGHARGVAILAATASPVEIVEYSPLEVKKAVVGTGGASKEQIQKMVQVILKLPEIAFEDASDALAVAICHCQASGLKKLIDECLKRNDK